MNFISLFFTSMRMASKVAHASHIVRPSGTEELIDELCAPDRVKRVETRPTAGHVEIDDSLPNPA